MMNFKWNSWIFVFLICFLTKLAAAHLGQSCNFNLCLNALMVPIKHAFCDNDNRCKCKEGYVMVSQHRCSETQYPGKPCENDDVCRLKEENSFCDQNRRFPICECKKSHIYDSQSKKCIPYVKRSKKSTPLFPMTAIILIACIGIFCGCGIICHNFRRQPELSFSVENVSRSARSNNHHNASSSANSARNSNNSHNNNNQNGTNHTVTTTTHPPLLRRDSHSSSSKYDSLLYDDPPPKYEDAIKDYQDEMINESRMGTPCQVVVAKS